MGDIFAQREVAKGAIRIDGVVEVEPAGQLVDHGYGVGLFGDAGVVALHGSNEGFSHAVGLRAFNGRRARAEVDLAGEAAGSAAGLAATVIRQPFDG